MRKFQANIGFNTRKKISVEDYCLQHYSTYSSPKRIVYPAAFREEILPKSVHPELSWKFLNLAGRQTPEAFVLNLPSARVWGANGAVITKENLLLADISREFGARNGHSFLRQKFQPRPVKIPGVVAVLVSAGADTYYHWMFDILPRLHLIDKAGLTPKIDKFLFPPILHAYQKETLNYLAIDASKLLEAETPSFYIEADHLIAPSLPSLLGTINSWGVAYVRNLFFSRQLPTVDIGERIYISRKMAGNRKISNEEELKSLLEKFGFDIIEAENYSLLEQAAIFKNAKIVMGPHGSGFTNIVFSSPGTLVIELFSSNFVVPCFWTLANLNSLNYYCVLNEEVDKAFFDPYWEGTASDYVFPLRLIEQTFALAGISIK